MQTSIQRAVSTAWLEYTYQTLWNRWFHQIWIMQLKFMNSCWLQLDYIWSIYFFAFWCVTCRFSFLFLEHGTFQVYSDVLKIHFSFVFILETKKMRIEILQGFVQCSARELLAETMCIFGLSQYQNSPACVEIWEA